jgi:3-(3-hydroxy-phenyl)propionate hydroxylase
MSNPVPLVNSPLNTPDTDEFAGALRPGSPCPNLGLAAGDEPSRWLHDELGPEFSGLYFAPDTGDFPASVTQAMAELARPPVPIETRVVTATGGALREPLPPGARPLVDAQGILARLLDARPGTFYLIRPDRYVSARWRQFDARRIRQALARAIARELPEGRADVEARHG